MILVGVAGWSYPDWEGRVYPRRKPRGFHPLAYLARYVDLMEINGTFYATPDPRHAERWAGLVAQRPAFRFTAKLHQGFTHGALADVTLQAAAAFRRGVGPLADAGRLLALLAQFPVTFRESPAGWERLQRLRECFADLHLVLELRHRSWFTPQALSRLATLGPSLAHIDLPAARDHPPAEHPTLGSLAYLRLHGRNSEAWFAPSAGRDARYDYRYPPAEVEALTAHLQGLAARSEHALLVANNHFQGKAVAAALEIKSALGQAARAPACLLDAFPDLAGRVVPEGQGSLLWSQDAPSGSRSDPARGGGTSSSSRKRPS